MAGATPQRGCPRCWCAYLCAAPGSAPRLCCCWPRRRQRSSRPWAPQRHAAAVFAAVAAARAQPGQPQPVAAQHGCWSAHPAALPSIQSGCAHASRQRRRFRPRSAWLLPFNKKRVSGLGSPLAWLPPLLVCVPLRHARQRPAAVLLLASPPAVQQPPLGAPAARCSSFCCRSCRPRPAWAAPASGCPARLPGCALRLCRCWPRRRQRSSRLWAPQRQPPAAPRPPAQRLAALLSHKGGERPPSVRRCATRAAPMAVLWQPCLTCVFHSPSPVDILASRLPHLFTHRCAQRPWHSALFGCSEWHYATPLIPLSLSLDFFSWFIVTARCLNTSSAVFLPVAEAAYRTTTSPQDSCRALGSTPWATACATPAPAPLFAGPSPPGA